MSITDTQATQLLGGTLPTGADPMLTALTSELQALAADLTATKPTPNRALAGILAGGRLPSTPPRPARRMLTRAATGLSGLGLGVKLTLAAGVAAAALGGAELSDDLPHPLHDLVDRFLDVSTPPPHREPDLPQPPGGSDDAKVREPWGEEPTGSDADPDVDVGQDHADRQEPRDLGSGDDDPGDDDPGGDGTDGEDPGGEDPDGDGTDGDGTDDDGTDDERHAASGTSDDAAQPEGEDTQEDSAAQVDDTEPAITGPDDGSGS